MFNLFKSQEALVREIHNEFDTAEDRLLEQADKLLKELEVPIMADVERKAERLKKLGFNNSETVKRAEVIGEKISEQNRKLVSTKEQAELIKYYKQNYPFQKFLTEGELKRICNKYGLIFAPVSKYQKDVPNKNLSEIECAPPLKNIDTQVNSRFLRITDFWYCVEKEIKNKLSGLLDVSNAADSDIDLILGGAGDWVLKRILNINYSGYIYKKAELIIEDKGGLFIAAPKSHFNLDGLTKKNKYSFLSISITEVTDPIVFRYCRGGVQVLSKWGLEAEDESLVNEKMN